MVLLVGPAQNERVEPALVCCDGASDLWLGVSVHQDAIYVEAQTLVLPPRGGYVIPVEHDE